MTERSGVPLPLSVCVPTKNEADTVGQCLASVDGWVDEIVVLDSGSDDGTVDVCRSYGAEVHEWEFEGFTEMYRTVLGLAQNDWVLFLDADEVVSDALRDEIVTTLPETDSVAFDVPIRNHMFGGRVRTPQSKTCLAKADVVEFHQEYVHSQMGVRDEYRDRVDRLSSPIDHYAYDRVSAYLTKFDQYTSLEAIRIVESSTSPSYPRFLVKGVGVFIYHLLVNRGILDGYRGVLFATLSFQYVVTTHAKIQDLKRLRNENPEGWRATWLEEECQR